jgi:hypothetical protein
VQEQVRVLGLLLEQQEPEEERQQQQELERLQVQLGLRRVGPGPVDFDLDSTKDGYDDDCASRKGLGDSNSNQRSDLPALQTLRLPPSTAHSKGTRTKVKS